MPKEIKFDGERLQEIRKDKGYTQKRFAELIGVVSKTVTDYEGGKTNPSARFWRK